MDNDVSFGLWLEKRRKSLDLTREELANKIGSSVSALRKIEADERRPSKQLAELLANALDIPIEELPTFIRIARGEFSIERLKVSPLSPIPSLLQPTQAFPKPIPIPPTPLIGRETELAALRQMLNDSQCRLITLLGPGGSGKTRLAVQAAVELNKEFPNQVCFVPLAGVRSTEFIIPSIAEALHFTFAGSLDPREQLLVYLKAKTLFLVLDNFEQLLDGVDLLAEILQQTLEIKLLVSSRERLNLHGEWVFEVQGLQLPGTSTEDIMAYGATTLFVQSARRTKLNYVITTADAPAIIRICNLVQGMPLGIELAASWMRTLSCHEIALEVERSLDFLATPMRGIPDRHHSMRAVFDHSWNLLSEAEQRVFHQLSIFRSGFQREAAEQVAGANLSILAALIDKSLLRRTPAGRYEIHELLRQYAEAKQTERPGELEAASQRHSAYYADVMQRLHRELISIRQAEAVAETSAEMDNIRAAWQYAVEHEQILVLHRFIRGLWHFYEIRGWFKEGGATYRWAVENLKRWPVSGDETESAAIVLQEFLRAHYTWFDMRLGHWGEASRLAQESVVKLRALEAWPELAAVLHLASVALWGTGQYPEARVLLEEKITLEHQFENPWDLSMGYGQLGLVYQGMGDYQQARELMSMAQGLIEECGDKRMVGVSLYHRAGVEFDLGEFDSARAMLKQSLEISTAVGDRWTMGTSRLQLGLVAIAQGEYEQAIRWLREAQDFCQETGDRWGNTRMLNGLGTCLLALGNDAEAIEAFHEALAAASESGLWPEALDALIGFATWQIKHSAPEAARLTLEQVTLHPACSQKTSERASHLCEELESQLTSRQLGDALMQAQAKTFDVFVSEVLKTKP